MGHDFHLLHKNVMQKGSFYQEVSQVKIVCTQVLLFAFDPKVKYVS